MTDAKERDSEQREVQAALGRTIRDRRLALQWTRGLLAERSGVSEIYIGRIENGQADLSLSILLKIANGLDTTAGQLVGEVAPLSPEAIEMAQRFDQVSEEFQTVLLRLLQITQRGDV